MKGPKGEFNCAGILTHPTQKLGCPASPPAASHQAWALGCTLDSRSLEGTRARLDSAPDAPLLLFLHPNPGDSIALPPREPRPPRPVSTCLQGREASAERRAWLRNTAPLVQQPGSDSKEDISATSLTAALLSLPQGKLPRAKFRHSKPKSLLAVLSSMLSITPGAKEGIDLHSLGRTWMCRQPLQATAALWDCTQNADRTQVMPPKWSRSRQSGRLFREMITTLPPKTLEHKRHSCVRQE